MAIIESIPNSGASLSKIINYITRLDKTNEELIYGKDCSIEHAINQMKMTKEIFNKQGGTQYYHIVQSFDIDDVEHTKANEIAKKLAEEIFQGYEVILATHTDTDHVHTHFVINSVNFKTGKKLYWSRKALQDTKDYSDKLCLENGLSIIDKKEKNNNPTIHSKNKYKTVEKAKAGEYKSYVYDCYNAVKMATNIAKNKDEFIEELAKAGYSVNWSDDRKYITFVDGDGKKVRNSNLEKTFGEKFGKEDLLKTFYENKKAEEKTKEKIKKTMASNNRKKSYRSTNLFVESTNTHKSKYINGGDIKRELSKEAKRELARKRADYHWNEYEER